MEWLTFSLLPGDPHHHPPQLFHKNPPKYKTPSRKAKDRARTAAHQQALLLRTSSESELPLKDDVNHQPQGTDPVPAKQEVALALPHEPLLEADPAPPPPGLGQAAAPAVTAEPPKTEAVTASPPAATAVPLQEHEDEAAVSAAYPQNQTSNASQVQQTPIAAPASTLPDPEQKPMKTPQNPELLRKINRLNNIADRITMSFANNQKIAYSGCQREIQDKFWELVKKEPLEYFIKDKVDDDKLRESYKSTARSYGVRIY
jgi:hypothetical protein